MEGEKSDVGDQPICEITISLYKNGMVNVNGPIHDKITCFGLLRVAETVIERFKPQENKVITPKLILPQGLVAGRG